MAPFPLALADFLGHWGSYIVYLIIGIGFGAVLEMSGFGKSTKLAAQFYFKELTVLKVMFGAIVTAMVLIFLTSGLGLLDYNLVWVNPTYLWPGIVGGLIMGVGFIVGGFCPGTSLVAAATAKIDGIFFVLGAFFGIFLFGETVEWFEGFWYSSDMGRYTLPDLFGISTGAMVLIIALGALYAFWGAEQLEHIFGDKDAEKAPRWRYGAASAVVFVAIAGIVVGQPTHEDRWKAIADDKEALLRERTVQIHPGELLSLIHDDKLNPIMLDVRSEVDYNLFHILDAQHVPADGLLDIVPDLVNQPANTVIVVMSNDETAATEAWKTLVAETVPNVYILGGGINQWIDTFSRGELQSRATFNVIQDDQLHYTFDAALGARYPAAAPNPEAFELAFTPQVVLKLKRAPASGGCG